MRFALIVGVLVLGSSAQADDALVVVVESAHPGIRGAGLRRAMTRRGVPSVSVLDGVAETSGTLVIAVQRHRARMALTTPDGSVHVRYLLLDAEHPLELLANRATALVRSTLPTTEVVSEERVATSERVPSDVVDPWSSHPTEPQSSSPANAPSATEPIDPWRLEASPIARVYTEVLDPWASSRTRESPPESTRSSPPLRGNEVLDPWADPPSRRRDLRIPEFFRESASDLSSPPR